MRIQYSVILKEIEKYEEGFVSKMIQNKKSPEGDQGIIVSFGNSLVICIRQLLFRIRCMNQ